MKYIVPLIVLGAASLVLSLFLTQNLIYVLKKHNIVDAPSARRVHLKEVPRGGGVALVFIFSTLLPLFEYYLFDSIEYSIKILQISLPISIVSFWDDLFNVMIPIRLFVQMICALLAMIWVILPNVITHSETLIYIDLTIGSLALVTFLNIYNFLDGIDGITASETIHISITILILCFLNYETVPNIDMIIAIAVIILGWSIGFCYFNWSPAKIFLGDVGSVSIGFLLGICLLVIAYSSEKLFLSSILAVLYYIADGLITILIRLAKCERIWEPHLQHFFQKSVAKGRSHKNVVKTIIKCNMLLMLSSIASLYYPIPSIIGAILVVTVTLIRSIT